MPLRFDFIMEKLKRAKAKPAKAAIVTGKRPIGSVMPAGISGDDASLAPPAEIKRRKTA